MALEQPPDAPTEQDQGNGPQDQLENELNGFEGEDKRDKTEDSHRRGGSVRRASDDDRLHKGLGLVCPAEKSRRASQSPQWGLLVAERNGRSGRLPRERCHLPRIRPRAIEELA